MTLRLFVPRDATALSLGADRVALALTREAQRRELPIELVRNGSRGLFWLEPLVELDTPRGRVAYGPVRPEDVEGLLEAFASGGEHPLRQGRTEEIPYLLHQERLTFARVGLVDPLCIDEYVAHAGFRGLRNALDMPPAQIVQLVTESGLRGRGGAAFPTGIKWKTALDASAQQKYVVCNADEGDSGTFADRMLMEGDPYLLIEGLVIAGIAIGATQGYIYVRSEYPHALAVMQQAIDTARARGYLGPGVLGSTRDFDLQLRRAAGSYVCGEETALLESLEGRRGMVRARPPLPAVSGLFGAPTIVNNVLSLASVPVILDEGPAFYRDHGSGRSRGTLPIQLGGNVKRPGLIEKAFGVSLREVIYDYGHGTASGRPVRAVQVGGPLGAYLPESALDIPLDYEAFAAASSLLGHGGIVVFDDTVDMSRMARFAMEFCAHESCGKCTPCRIGSVRGVEVIDRIRARVDHASNVELLRDLCETLQYGSLCALGGMAPYPVLSALKHFPADFGIASVEEH